MTGRILDIRQYCVDDGPGLRTAVLLKGCRLRCAWCPTPMAIDPVPELAVDRAGCVTCGSCVQVCPHAAADADTPLVLGRRCLVCGRCVTACPRRVRRIVGEAVHVDTLTARLVECREQYGADGGVTFGGGEPLAQCDFVLAMADRLRDAHVHVAVETPCVAADRVIQRLPTMVNLVIARLALIDPARHRRWTGSDNRAILEAIAYLAGAMPGRLWLSVSLVEGVHDVAEVTRLADFAAALPNHVPIRLRFFGAADGDGDLSRIARGLLLQRGACLLAD